MTETADGVVLRPVTIADLATVLGEIGEFWDDPGMEFLHQALYVHEFGETSVLAVRDERDRRLPAGLREPRRHGLHPRRGGAPVGPRTRAGARRCTTASTSSWARAVRARLKAITRPGNEGSRAFHEALGFSVTLVEGYSPSGDARLVFRRQLGPG